MLRSGIPVRRGQCSTGEYVNFSESGFEILDQLISSDLVKQLLELLAQKKMPPLRGGIRQINKVIPEIDALAHSASLLSLAGKYLTAEPKLVRAIYFEKSPENNWLVSWHQDKTVAVSHQFEIEGWGPWSLKADVWHTQPPLTVLENMVTIRVHLDTATKFNGCLKVIPGSHLNGLLHGSSVPNHINNDAAIFCEIPAGGALIMRPHILHASSKSTSSTPRRVLHFEYSGFKLPNGIAWSN
jgi:hypothetical protein